MTAGVNDPGNYRTTIVKDASGTTTTVRQKAEVRTVEVDVPETSSTFGAPYMLASPRYIGDFVNGDPSGKVVYAYSVPKAGKIKRLKKQVFRPKGALTAVDQQPGNQTWYDSRPDDSKQTANIMSWWSTHGTRMNTHAYQEEEKLNYGAAAQGWNNGSGRVYLNGKHIASAPYPVLGAAYHVGATPTVRVVCRGPSSVSVPAYSELKLYEFTLADAGDTSAWTTRTIRVEQYEIISNIAPFNADAGKFCYIRQAGTTGWQLMECDWGSASPAQVFLSRNEVTGSYPAVTETEDSTYDGALMTTYDHVWSWDANRTDTRKIVIAADYVGLSLAYYYFEETYGVTYTLDGETHTTATPIAPPAADLYETFDHSNVINQTATKSFALHLNVGGSDSVVYSVPAWTAFSLVQSYIMTWNTDDGGTATTHDTYDKANFRTRLFHCIAADPRVSYIAFGVAESDPSIVVSGYYGLKLTLKEFVGSTELRSEEKTYSASTSVDIVQDTLEVSGGTSYPSSPKAFEVIWHKTIGSADRNPTLVPTYTATDLTTLSSDVNQPDSPWGMAVNMMTAKVKKKTVVMLSGAMACAKRYNRNWPSYTLLEPKLTDLWFAGIASSSGADFWNASYNNGSYGISFLHHWCYDPDAGTWSYADDKPAVAREVPAGTTAPDRVWVSAPIYLPQFKILK